MYDRLLHGYILYDLWNMTPEFSDDSSIQQSRPGVFTMKSVWTEGLNDEDWLGQGTSGWHTVAFSDG